VGVSNRFDLKAGVALGVGVASLTVYCLTAARFVTWGDSPELVAVARTLGIAHPPGYPLYTLLAAAVVGIPIGGAFLRLSILSAVFGAASAACLSLFVWHAVGLSGPQGREPDPVARSFGAVVGGLALALSPTFWSQATVPEVYTLALALVLAIVLVLVVRVSGSPGRPPRPRSLVLAGFLAGLALAHHLTAVFAVAASALGLGLARRARPRAREVALAGVAAAAGLSLYAYLPLRARQDPAILWTPLTSFGDVLRHVSGTQYASRLFAEPLPLVASKLGSFVAALPRELSWVVLALGVVGFWTLWRRNRTVALTVVLWAAMTFVHALAYRIPDVGSYYIPVYAVIAAAAGAGLTSISHRLGRRFGTSRTAIVLAALVGLVLVVRSVKLWPEMDLSRRDDARVFMLRMLEIVPPDGIVLAREDRTVFTLWYARYVEGLRNDVAILDARGRAPHLERWFPGVVFPSEEELARYFGRDPAPPCVPPTRASVPVAQYPQLLVRLNAKQRRVFADIDFGWALWPARALPRGLLVEVDPDAGPDEVERAWRESADLWLGYLAGLDSADGATRRAYADALGELGRLRLARGEPEAAVQLLERACELDPAASHIRNNLAAAYLKAGRPDDAVRELSAALERSPWLARARFNLYLVHLERGDAVSAGAALESARALDPANPDYAVELASFYERTGRVGDAERVLGRAQRRTPADWSVILAYGDLLARQAKYEEALSAYRRAATLNADSAGVLAGLSRCYWELGDHARAVGVMRRLVDLKPDDAGMRYDLAAMLYRGGELGEALRQVDTACEARPDLSQAWALRGAILERMGRVGEAKSSFERAQELAGDESRLPARSRIPGAPPGGSLDTRAPESAAP